MTKKERLQRNPIAKIGTLGLNHKLPIEMVFNAVCEYFSVTPEQLRAKTNKREIIIPRHVFFFLAREHTKCSLSYIGEYASNEYFNFNHSTVWFGVKKVREVRKFDYEINEAVTIIGKALEAKRKGVA